MSTTDASDPRCTCIFDDVCDGEGMYECLGCNGGEATEECLCPVAQELAVANADGEEYCCAFECEGCEECEDEDEEFEEEGA